MNRKPPVGARPPSSSESPLDMWRLTRRRFLGLSVATVAGAASAGFFLSTTRHGRVSVSWLSPRGTLAVVDDYPLWVALDLGYMRELGIDLQLGVGTEPVLTAPSTPSTAVSFPSPAALVSGVDRGLRTRAIFQLCSGSVFGFAVPAGGSRQRPQDLSGAVIAVGDDSWRQIVDPLLLEAGVDPRSTTLVVAGDRWLKLASSKAADAALSWRGLEESPDGRKLRHFVGDRWSHLPANAYAVEAPEQADAAAIDGLTRFLQATVMGLEFANHNPRATAQITRRLAPGLASTMSPQETVVAVAVTSSVYSAGRQRGLPWGFHEPARWRRFVEVAEEAGMVKAVDPNAVYTNRLINDANSIDRRRVGIDAATFALDREFTQTTSPTGG